MKKGCHICKKYGNNCLIPLFNSWVSCDCVNENVCNKHVPTPLTKSGKCISCLFNNQWRFYEMNKGICMFNTKFMSDDDGLVELCDRDDLNDYYNVDDHLCHTCDEPAWSFVASLATEYLEAYCFDCFRKLKHVLKE